MMRLRRASVIAVLSLLTSAATAKRGVLVGSVVSAQREDGRPIAAALRTASVYASIGPAFRASRLPQHPMLSGADLGLDDLNSQSFRSRLTSLATRYEQLAARSWGSIDVTVRDIQ